MATIVDVAKYAGVSKSTVSRFISGKGYVAKDVQKKIEKAIEELAYVPNEVARSLTQKKSKLIGLLLPDISNPYFPMLAKGVEEYFYEVGYQVILGNVKSNNEIEESYIESFSMQNVAGIITANSENENSKLKTFKNPIVMTDRAYKESEYGVVSDDFMGGKLSAHEMIKTHPKKVLVIKGPKGLNSLEERFKGMAEVLDEKHIVYDVYQSQSFDFGEVEQDARTIFQKFKEIDSMICPSDIHAIALLHEALKRNYNVPKDIQIIGYDDIPMSKFLYPALSTIRQPAYKIGMEAAKLLHALIDKRPVTDKKIMLPVTYIERETTRRK
ncbi:LacI family transcriptional regulator [Bacilli bacterium]|nr:LacI family transcriptional regulator [Bacilli bacterium]